MTATKTPTAIPATAIKPPSRSEIISNLLIYIVIIAFPLQCLFNACIANVYHFTEMSYRLAFLVTTPLVMIYYWINKMHKEHMYYQNQIYQETLNTRYLSQYILEYAAVNTMRLDDIVANLKPNIVEDYKTVDTEGNLS